jgi:hypothetical protein
MPSLWRGALAALALAASPAAAQECRIALSLGIDVSNSVDAAEYRLQTRGLAAALTAPEVRAAFFSAPGRVALQVFEWSGRRQQSVRQDWMMIAVPADLDAVAARLRAQERSAAAHATALGHAMRFGAVQLERGPVCAERKLDLAGDGENNDGLEPADALRPGAGPLTINALAIGPERAALAEYFAENVIRGPGAFVELARDHADFERAMRRKLVRELLAPFAGPPARPVRMARR